MQNKKLKEKVNWVINDYIKRRYGFNTEARHNLAWQLIDLIEQHYEVSNKHNPAKQLASKWFSSKAIKGDIDEHSVGGFADWLVREYFIIAIPKRQWYSKARYKILKWLWG